MNDRITQVAQQVSNQLQDRLKKAHEEHLLVDENGKVIRRITWQGHAHNWLQETDEHKSFEKRVYLDKLREKLIQAGLSEDKAIEVMKEELNNE